MQSKKIIFITYDGLTDPLGQSQILPYYIGLSQKGYSISILSNEKEENFNEHQTVIADKLQEAGIDWKFTFYQNKPPVLGTLSNIRRMKSEAKKWNVTESFDIVHCRSIIPAIIGKALTEKSSIKLVFDIRGFWADERVEGGLWNLKNPIYYLMYRFFKNQEKILFKEADYIISLTENAKVYILEHFETKGRIQVIPCAADLKHFDYNAINKNKLEKLRTELGINKEEYIISYIGSLGTRYRLTDMLRFFKQLKSIKKNARFLFISRHNRNEIINEAEELDIAENDIVIKPSTYQEIPYYIALSQASIFFIVTSFSGKAVSPTKQAEVMGLGIPIVANSGLGDTDLILNEKQSGVTLHGYDDANLLEGVNELINREFSPETIREVAKKRFALNTAVDNYAGVYENL